MKLSFWNIVKTTVPLGIGIYLIWYLFHSLSPETLAYFYKALREANYMWIALSLTLTFAAYAIRAYRWKYALEPLGYTSKFKNRYHALMIGYLINLTIPRAGEASRAAMLYKSDGIPFGKSFGTIIAERAIDLMMLGGIALIAMWTNSDRFDEMFTQIQQQFGGDSNPEQKAFYARIFYLIAGVCILAFVLLLALKQKLRSLIWNFIKQVLDGLTSVFKSKNPLPYLFYTLLIWGLYLVYFGVTFFSLKETADFPVEGMLLAFIAGSLGITFTNGGIGVFPLLIRVVIVLYLGADNPNALGIGTALGMLIWSSQTLFLILLGLISLTLQANNYSKEDV